MKVSSNPTDGNHLTNKTYVDSLVQGLDIKQSVKVATTMSFAFPTPPASPSTPASPGGAVMSVDGHTFVTTIDGINVNENDRVLFKDQSNESENGIYIKTTTGWERASDFALGTDVVVRLHSWKRYVRF